MVQLNPGDFWLISDIRSGIESTISISAAPLTDHSMVKLCFISSNTNFKKGFWKFSSNLLNNESFCQEVINVINNINTDTNIQTYREKWEYLKYKVRQISIFKSKLLSRIRQKKELEIIKEINNICNRPLSEHNRQKLLALQSSLDTICISKAKGAYLRSRANGLKKEKEAQHTFVGWKRRDKTEML